MLWVRAIDSIAPGRQEHERCDSVPHRPPMAS